MKKILILLLVFWGLIGCSSSEQSLEEDAMWMCKHIISDKGYVDDTSSELEDWDTVEYPNTKLPRYKTSTSSDTFTKVRCILDFHEDDDQWRLRHLLINGEIIFDDLD